MPSRPVQRKTKNVNFLAFSHDPTKFFAPKSIPLELPWHSGDNRSSRSRVISEHTDKHTYRLTDIHTNRIIYIHVYNINVAFYYLIFSNFHVSKITHRYKSVVSRLVLAIQKIAGSTSGLITFGQMPCRGHLSVCQAGDCSYSFTRWHHLQPLLHYCSHLFVTGSFWSPLTDDHGK